MDRYDKAFCRSAAAPPPQRKGTPVGKDNSFVTGSEKYKKETENNCQTHAIHGILRYRDEALKFLERKRKLGQKFTITIFYYITINRSSTV